MKPCTKWHFHRPTLQTEHVFSQNSVLILKLCMESVQLFEAIELAPNTMVVSMSVLLYVTCFPSTDWVLFECVVHPKHLHGVCSEVTENFYIECQVASNTMAACMSPLWLHLLFLIMCVLPRDTSRRGRSCTPIVAHLAQTHPKTTGGS